MPENTQKNIISRLNRIEGQVRGIKRMIEEDGECIEILNQISAVRAAINSVGILVFEHHAQDCIRQVQEDPSNEESFEEIVKMLGRMIK